MKIRLLLLTLLSFSFAIYNSSAQEIKGSFEMPQLVRQADINSLQWLDDGKILVGGRINFYEDQSVSHLIRLNNDGTLDDTFLGTSDHVVMTIDTLTTGEIIVGTNAHIRKLSADGVMIEELLLSEDDNLEHIVLGEDFMLVVVYHNYSVRRVSKYDLDLKQDEDFTTLNFSGHLMDVALHQGKVLVSGFLLMKDGQSISSVSRFNMDGTEDETFVFSVSVPESWGDLDGIPFEKLYVTDEDEIYIQARAYNGFLKLSATGNQTAFVFDDTDFRIDVVDASFIDQDNNIYYIGYSNYYGNNDSYGRRLVKYDGNGNLIDDFQISMLTEKNPKDPIISVNLDGDVLVGNINNLQNRYGLNKIQSSGLVVTGFTPEVGTYGSIEVAEVDGDRFVVAGDFNRLNDFITNDIAVLDLNGSVDESFSFNGALERTPTDIGFYNGNIFVANGSEVRKFLSDGQIDETFNTQPEFLFQGFSIVWFGENIHIQSDGKIVTTSPNGVFRMDENGNPDNSYGPYYPSPTITTAFDSDMDKNDRVIFGGNYDQLKDGVFSDIAKINSDGTFDESFQVVRDSSSGYWPGITNITALTNGETIVFGFFERFSNYAAPRRMVKLDKDGKVDTRFLSFVNQTFNVAAGNLDNYTSFRGGFMVAGSNSYQIIDDEFVFNYQLHVFNNSGIYQTEFGIPDAFQPTKRIIPLIINNNDIILISEFRSEDQAPIHGIRLKVNNLPKITSHIENIVLDEAGFNLIYDHLEVEDSDNVYPDDFEIQVYDGLDFSVNGTTIIPSEGFSGELEVLVTVKDGSNESNFVVIPMSVGNPLSADDDLGIEVFPNPTSDIVRIKAHDSAEIEIRDLAGNSIAILDGPSNFDLSKYEPGVYLFRIKDSDGKVVVKKVIKQ
ncbi:T9SS type A sorting domain-containing protein [Ekhidna sp.]